MSHRVCPWYLGYFLLAPWRRLFNNPEKVAGPYIRQGMTALDVGSGMGYFSLPMARMVGPAGKVVCVDLQEQMVKALVKRTGKAGLSGIIDARVSRQDSLLIGNLVGRVDFALLFAVVHEVPDRARLFSEIYAALKPGGLLLIAEPKGHVRRKDFENTAAAAFNCGFREEARPAVSMSHTMLLKKPS